MAAKDIPFDGTLRMGRGSLLRFYDLDETHYVGLKPPAAVATSVDYQWPTAPPSGLEYVLACNSSGVMSWVTREDVAGEEVYNSEEPVTVGAVDEILFSELPLVDNKDTFIELDIMGRYDPVHTAGPRRIRAHIALRWESTVHSVFYYTLEIDYGENVSGPDQADFVIDNTDNHITIYTTGIAGYDIHWTGKAKILSI